MRLPASLSVGFTSSIVNARFNGDTTAFVAVENLFDNRYDVGRTPILTTGLPRAVRAGVQVWLR